MKFRQKLSLIWTILSSDLSEKNKQTQTSKPTSEVQSASLIPSTDFKGLEDRILIEKNGIFYINNVPIQDNLRSSLRDEARNFQTTRLYSLLDERITNEAMQMSLNNSQNWEHVLSAKQLYHWNHVMKNIVHKLSQ